MDPERISETNGLRTFANVVFYLLLIAGAICVILGFILAANPVTELASLGATVIMSGGLCVLSAFGLRLILRVFADMADDARASREILAEIAENTRKPAVRSAPAKPASSPAKPVSQRSGRIPMPPPRGTSNHPPMPPLHGSDN